jgi:prophage regulatory protein
MTTPSNPLPETGYLRIWHIVGNKKRGIPALIPVSRSTFLAKVKSGEYPIKAVKLGQSTTAFRVEDIRKLIESFGGKS